jgi:hypothetical protein
MAEPALDVARFERGDFDPSAFSHREHVRLGFEMLRRYSFPEAALRFSKALRSMTQRIGKPQIFHQTITIAFLSLIAEGLAAAEYADFESFAAAHPQLMDKSALARWYGPERLATEAARQTFVLPDPQTSRTAET